MIRMGDGAAGGAGAGDGRANGSFPVGVACAASSLSRPIGPWRRRRTPAVADVEGPDDRREWFRRDLSQWMSDEGVCRRLRLSPTSRRGSRIRPSIRRPTPNGSPPR